MIAHSSSLEEVDLNGNAVGDDGAAALAKSLKVTPPVAGAGDQERMTSTLMILRLRDNQIGDAGAGAFVEHVDQNRKLTTLDLSGNEGVSADRFHILDLMLKHRAPRRASTTGDGVLIPPMSPLRQDQSEKTVLNIGRKALQSSNAVEVSQRFLELVTDNFDAENVLSYGAFGEHFQMNDTENQRIVQRTPLDQTDDKRDVREQAVQDILVSSRTSFSFDAWCRLRSVLFAFRT